MPSSRQPPALALAIAAFVAVGAFPKGAQADATTPQGFAVERFYPSAPGGGWFVMDALDMHGNLGGAMAFTSGYALKPLRVTDGSRTLPVVEDEAVADFGFAATYDRFRLYLDLQMPFLIAGQGGPVGNYWFVHPAVDLGSNPDTLADARIGFDARLYGSPTGAFRLGAGAQLLLPSGRRSDYDTDGTYRAMLRVLAAGDVGWFTYAGQVGVHVRPLDDAPIPGSPQGSELLFGVAAGAKLGVAKHRPGRGPGGLRGDGVPVLLRHRDHRRRRSRLGAPGRNGGRRDSAPRQARHRRRPRRALRRAGVAAGLRRRGVRAHRGPQALAATRRPGGRRDRPSA